MSVYQMQTVLEAIDLDLTRKDMVVLGALLKAQSDVGVFVSFKSLREQLATDEGERRGKDSLIYRSLSWLEQTGLIRVDKSGHTHGYNSNMELIHDVVKQMIQERSIGLAKEIKAVDAEIQVISEINPDLLAADIIALASGIYSIERPVFVQGWNNILRLMDEKIYNGLKKDAVLRFTLDWYNRTEESEEPRLLILESLLESGVEMRGLEHKKAKMEIVQRFERRINHFKQAGYKVGFRFCTRKSSTYQFVGRNSEGILLIVSENPLSATWLPRSANPELVDDAIRTFDRDYIEGEEVSDLGE
jgi:Fe2+ or Zn2+ uptake regulation protein